MEVQVLFQLLFRVSVLKFFHPIQKCYFFSTTSASSASVSLEICLLSFDSKNFLKEVRPSLCRMLGERPTTSMVHRIAPGILNVRFNFLSE